MKKPINIEPEELFNQLIEQQKLNAAQQATILKLSEQLEQLQQRIDKLLQLLYGVKSEKKKRLASSSREVLVPTPQNQKNRNATSSKFNGRRPLPSDLPRVQVEHDVPEIAQQCQCCQHKMHRMGKVITEQLECEPAKLYVIEHIRYKYSCQQCKQNIVTADLPRQPIDKGLAGSGLLTEVVLNKYQYHLPLHRQEQRFSNLGIALPRSTLCDWVKQIGIMLKPIVELMKTDALISSKRIFSDDTTCPVLAKDKTHTGRLWVYIGGGTDEPNCVIYDYTKNRSQTAPQKFLKGYQGYLQADAYKGYDILYKDGSIVEVACLAHCRRYFMDIVKSVKKKNINDTENYTSLADIAVNYIGELYDVERKIKGLPPLHRKYYRRIYSKPISKRFYRWLKRNQAKVLPKSPIGKAIAYSLNHWHAFNNYRRDGILKIDNNTSERAMKSVVLGRKNYMFAGSHDGAATAAVIYSIIETCKLNHINTFTYLRDVLTRLPSTLIKDLVQLLPYNWKPLI